MEFLQDLLQDEMILQIQYNKYMTEISNPEVRQLFTQLRDTKMQNISQLQQEIKIIMDQDKTQ
ncbi:spore coat protein [Clostridium sp.]|uniref:spore coat protein n=1 Tax=Clostridium sp. TaxID=1506 RepID=UPI00261F2627|nr:spore coat protein [uncultured Clostridium sp.]